MTFPGYPSLGLLAPADQGFAAPAPFARKPSIVDRVAAKLFPMSGYSGLLDPETQASIQRQGLQQFGTNLLQASGPSTMPIGLGQAVGASLGGVNLPQMAQQALQLQALRAAQMQQAQRAAIGKALAEGGGAGEQPASAGNQNTNLRGTIERILPLFTGDPEMLKMLLEIHKSLATETRNLQEVSGIVDTRLTSATKGMTGTGLVDSQGRLVQFYPKGQEPTKIGPEVPLAYAKDFEAAIAPSALAKQSYDTYKSNQAEAGATVDQTRLAAAINVILPGSHITGAQLTDPAVAQSFKGTFLGPIVAAFDPKTGTLPPAERASLDRLVETAAGLRRHEARAIVAQKRRLAPAGINAESYLTDPWQTTAAGDLHFK